MADRVYRLASSREPGYLVEESRARRGRERDVGERDRARRGDACGELRAVRLSPRSPPTYLAVRTTPTVRDLLVSLSWVVTLVLAFWLFVRIQRTGKA
jgi:hypothetical protein